MILMSLNGIKLVVTRLASPARIGLQRLFLAGICEELKYRSPVILSRGFVHLAPDNQKHSLSITRNARRRSKFTCAEEAIISPFLEVDCVHAGRAYAVFPGSRLFSPACTLF